MSSTRTMEEVSGRHKMSAGTKVWQIKEQTSLFTYARCLTANKEMVSVRQPNSIISVSLRLKTCLVANSPLLISTVDLDLEAMQANGHRN